MKFFLPFIEDIDSAEVVYSQIIKTAESLTGKKVFNKRIFSIHSTEVPEESIYTVGILEELTGRVVFAILETDTEFLICLPQLEAIIGSPMVVSKNEVNNIILFDD